MFFSFLAAGFCPKNLVFAREIVVLPESGGCSPQSLARTPMVVQNSYWVPHAGSENHCETRKSLKICYLSNTNQE